MPNLEVEPPEDITSPPDYVRPEIEAVLTPQDLDREVLFAGTLSPPQG